MELLLKIHYLFTINIPLVAGVIIILKDYESVIAYAVGGWLIYLVNSIFFKAIFEINKSTRSKAKRGVAALLFWIPLIGLTYWFGWEGPEVFFVGAASFECIALVLGLVLMFLFGTGIDGQRSFKSLGTGMVVFVIILFLAFGYPYLKVLLEFKESRSSYQIYSILGVIIYQTVLSIGDIKTVRNASMSGLYVEKDENPLKIVGMIFGWGMGLVALQAIINGLD